MTDIPGYLPCCGGPWDKNWSYHIHYLRLFCAHAKACSVKQDLFLARQLQVFNFNSDSNFTG